MEAGRGVAGGIGLHGGRWGRAVIGNNIRSEVERREDEIEVMKLCGATDTFVGRPFVVEGTLQGALSAGLALIVLFAGFLVLRGHLDASVGALAGINATFLHPAIVAALFFGGGLIGALGSAFSLKRYLAV